LEDQRGETDRERDIESGDNEPGKKLAGQEA